MTQNMGSANVACGVHPDTLRWKTDTRLSRQSDSRPGDTREVPSSVRQRLLDDGPQRAREQRSINQRGGGGTNPT